MAPHLFEADKQHGQKLNPTIHAGYLSWARHVVTLMQTSTMFSDAVELVAMPWAHHMAHQEGAEEKDSLVGRTLMVVGSGACLILGTVQKTVQMPSSVAPYVIAIWTTMCMSTSILIAIFLWMFVLAPRRILFGDNKSTTSTRVAATLPALTLIGSTTMVVG